MRRPRLLSGLLLLGLALSPVRAQEPAIAPAWTLKTPQGETVSYPQDAQNQPAVLLFWPSWCPYSRALQPYVQDIWEDYRDTGVRVWTLNIRETGDPVRAMTERGLDLPLLLDADALIPRYGISRTPWLVVADGRQRIVYTRQADPPTPVDVARDTRRALNALLGARAVPLPASYPPPYDLHLRLPARSRLQAEAVADAIWRPWAEQYLAEVGPREIVATIPPRGPVNDGKTAIALARELWTRAYGAEATRAQAPYRAFRRNELWLVAGRAYADTLGHGFILVVEAETGQVLRLRGATASSTLPP